MIAASNVTTTQISLADWLNNPPPRTDWVNEFLRQKRDMTLKHSKIQRRLSTLWSLHVDAHQLGGEVYTKAPCQTKDRGRSPDVAYLTPDLLDQRGDAKVLPQNSPLSGEIVSPTDLAEDILAKAKEYLGSGGDEVWLVYPEAGWILIMTADLGRYLVEAKWQQRSCICQDFRSASMKCLLSQLRSPHPYYLPAPTGESC
jgi:Uma2 family endonuclease